MLAGGGLSVVSCSTAGEPESRTESAAEIRNLSTISCPDVGDSFQGSTSTDPATQESLGLLDQQVADAYQTLVGTDGSPKHTEDVLADLATRRRQTIAEIADSRHTAADQRSALLTMATCSVKSEAAGPAADGAVTALSGQNGKGAKARANGLSSRDFVDITKAQPNAAPPTGGKGASTGTFSSRCGTNENQQHLNADNVIVTPGVQAAAHHEHDYVGNTSTDFRSSLTTLQAARTTCTNGDLSTYYAPVVRLLGSPPGQDANRPGGGPDQNQGSILTPAGFDITFRGNPAGPVQAMDFGTRIITGDAKAFTNGPGNAHASWSCSGFENIQFKDKYPLCPANSKMVRTFAFPDCSNGQQDSANHRSHTAFANDRGQCPKGFHPVPQLVMTVSYVIPPGQFYAVDSFPEQVHKPVTDHADFINVMNRPLMDKAVACINSGMKC
ncbi:DUF1996 domain-containing protein [Kitasatospora sp. NPDC057904]|uniref:DUF1996 domain-containing protein n=1 Tax=unclassified Kitasatospora TaxID=2633591 RepID=UPI0036DC861A